MDREEIKELADYLLPLAESNNASKSEMTTDYDEKWEFFMGFRKKKNHAK